MAAVNTINKYAPFFQYEMLTYASRQQAKLALFGELSDDEIWADFLFWLVVGHTGRHLDLELIHRAATRLGGEVGLTNLDVKMQEWFLSTPHEHKQEILAAFLDGYKHGFTLANWVKH